jgi:SsrA-binding protein
VQRDGYTLMPTALYWKGNKVKAELALAKGKQSHDKRASVEGPRLEPREAAA